mgnify:CR=1 FL=1
MFKQKVLSRYQIAASVKWLFHTTSWKALDSILRSKMLRGEYVSLSENPFLSDIRATEVALKLDASKLHNVQKVQYTEEWYKQHPTEAAYIAGDGWREQFSYDGVEDDTEAEEAVYREAELESFLHKTGELEWIADGDLDIDGAIVALVLLTENLERDKERAENLAKDLPIEW